MLFVISSILTNIASKYKEKKYVYKFLGGLSVALPAFLAGFRDVSVGTDTESYYSLFLSAQDYPLLSFLDFSNVYPYEYGYLLLTFVSAHFFPNVIFFSCFVYFIIVLFVFISAMRLSDYLNPGISMLCFFLLFYCESYNILRQYLSIVLLLYGIVVFILGKTKQFYIFLILAVSVHTTAILGLSFPFVRNLLERYPLKRFFFIYFIAIFILALIILGLSNLSISISESDVSNKLNAYLENSSGKDTMSYSTFIIYLLSTAAVFVKYVSHSKDRWLELMCLLGLLSITFLLGAYVSKTMYRLSLYFSITFCVSIPYILTKKSPLKSTKPFSPIVFLSLISIYLFYWVFSIIIRGSHSVYPYKFLIESYG